MRFIILASSILFLAHWAAAGERGRVFGKVEDSSHRAVPGVHVQVQSESTGARWKTATGDDGNYSVTGLTPGRYKVIVRSTGFRTVSRVGAVLDSAADLQIDFAMELLGLHEVVTVTDGRDALNPAGASNLLVTRDSPGASLPANGGDYRVLFDLLPGVITTPAITGDAGQFTSNGQRPNSNTFRVDGVSANTGVGSNTLPGSFPGASLPAMTAIGSTENLVSNATAQSLELRTSDFSPEFSDRPGAEALVHTRSGSNEFHEEFFGHLRDSGWTARDWFANRLGFAFPRPSYRRVGGVFGGPIWRNRTFYFVSAESTHLTDTGIRLTSVPSLSARENAPDKLKQLFNFYPLPSGPELGGGEAEGLTGLNESGELLSTSARVDQSFGSKGNLFVRLVESPSKSGANRFNWASGTLGFTATGTGGIHDLRFNYSRADLLFASFGGGPGYADAVFGVAGLLPGFSFLPGGGVTFSPPAVGLTSILPQLDSSQTILGLSVPGLGQFISFGVGKARQDQWEFRETFSKTLGRHEMRAGADYVQLQPSRDLGTYAVMGVASSLENLLQSQPLAVTASSPAQNGGKVHEVVVFAQDTFRINEKLSLLYGIGWDITPPTSTQAQIPTVSGLWTGTEWKGAYTGDINGTAAWPLRFGQVAPRIGVAYRLPGSGFVLRAGAGTYYDATLGASVNPINGAPFNSWLLSTGGSGSATSGAGSGVTPGQTVNSEDVQRFLLGAHRALLLPVSYQWRVSVEKQIGSRGVGSVAYLGAAGRNLLGHQAYVDPATGVLQRMVTLTENSANYQALQMRYSGSIARNVYGSVSYTWSHSIDDGSQDSSTFLIHPGYKLSEARGSSSFDVRHALTAALSYRIPSAVSSLRLPAWMAGWTLSGTARIRTGFPIDVLNSDPALGQAFNNIGRPDRVPGVPVWIADASVPGRRRLNPAAFRATANGTEGTLGRNVITGNGLKQLDASLRREFPIFRGISAEVGLNVFNVLNHPAFADPVPVLSSPWFGQSTSMQNMMLGSGTPNTGLPPLFQTGGARSAEFSFRVSF